MCAWTPTARCAAAFRTAFPHVLHFTDEDNDFLIGLCGKELQPLSHLVQAMRKTTQTSGYMASLGPFFVGHALWQSPLR